MAALEKNEEKKNENVILTDQPIRRMGMANGSLTATSSKCDNFEEAVSENIEILDGHYSVTRLLDYVLNIWPF